MIAPLLLGLTLAANAPAPKPVPMSAVDVAAGKGDGWFVEVETRPVERLEVKEGTFFEDETKSVLFFCPSGSRCIGDLNAAERDKGPGHFGGRVYVSGEDGFVTAGVPMNAVTRLRKSLLSTSRGVRVVVLPWVSADEHGPESFWIMVGVNAFALLSLLGLVGLTVVYAQRRAKRLARARSPERR